MSSSTISLAALRASTATLLAGLDAEQWSDADVHAPSLLPGWRRGHVLTHLARNADGIVVTLEGGLRGEVLARYPAGPQGRAADIDAGADRTAAELLIDVRQSAERLDRAYTAVAAAPGGWALATEKQRPASAWLLARWQEVEIHHVDLRGAYTAERWPPLFVQTLLPRLMAGLGDRATTPLHVQVTADGSVTTDLPGTEWRVGSGRDQLDVRGPDWALVAWLIGRPDAPLSATPALTPWL